MSSEAKAVSDGLAWRVSEKIRGLALKQPSQLARMRSTMGVVFLLAAFVTGFASARVGLPPLVGYLVAGYGLHALGFESTDEIEIISDAGVLVLLFGVGLKLRLRTLSRPHVWGPAGLFAIAGMVGVTALLLLIGAGSWDLGLGLNFETALIVALALSFSSTVFAIKALERNGETASLSGRISVGILVIQDIIAVVFLATSSGSYPSIWAILVVPGLLVLRPMLAWILDRSDHGEVLILLGLTLALGVGAGSFQLVGLKPDLGALLVGLILASHRRAAEMADRLLAFKDILLVGFFLSIGLGGMPPAGGFVIALLVLLILPIRSLGLLWILTRFRLRARTALQTSITLSTYSEFGLIAAAAAVSSGLLDSDWLSTIGVIVAGSLIVASAVSGLRYRLYDRWRRWLLRLEREPILPEDSIIDCGDAQILIFGMGRVGVGAYDQLALTNPGRTVGVDRSQEAVEANLSAGRSVVRGDALDRDFWERVRFHPEVTLVLAAMGNHRANLECVRRIREFLPDARIAAIATYPDQVEELREAGVDVARNLYGEAGQALADDALSVGLGE